MLLARFDSTRHIYKSKSFNWRDVFVYDLTEYRLRNRPAVAPPSALPPVGSSTLAAFLASPSALASPAAAAMPSPLAAAPPAVAPPAAPPSPPAAAAILPVAPPVAAPPVSRRSRPATFVFRRLYLPGR
jgi:hypothetical protein